MMIYAYFTGFLVYFCVAWVHGSDLSNNTTMVLFVSFLVALTWPIVAFLDLLNLVFRRFGGK